MVPSSIGPGTLLECYRVVRQLASESWEDTLEAVDQHRKTPVLVRVVNLDDEFRAREMARWRQELRRPGELLQTRIVAACDGGATRDGRPWYAAPLPAGESLRQRLDGRPLEQEAAVRLALELAGQLAELHGAGFVHGDLRPANVLLATPDGGARLLVPGVRRAFAVAFAPRLLFPGDGRYEAPEVAAGAVAGERADVWSFGLVLLEALTGLQPAELAAVASAEGADPAEAAAMLRMQAPTLPAWACALAPRCLAPEPAVRPADGRELLSILVHLVNPTALSSLEDAASAPPASAGLLSTGDPAPGTAEAASIPRLPVPVRDAVEPQHWRPGDPASPALWEGATGRTDYSAFYPMAFCTVVSLLPALFISVTVAKSVYTVMAVFCILELSLLLMVRAYFGAFGHLLDRLYGWMGWREDTWAQIDNRTDGNLELLVHRPGTDRPECSTVRPGVREILTLPPGTRIDVRPELPPDAPPDALTQLLCSCTLDGPKIMEVAPGDASVRDGQ